MDTLALWIAQGFGVGRIPWAPGTFGSALGLLWVAALLLPHSALFYLFGTLFGLACSVWFCGRAERILGKIDPGSVVLDEVAALPVCFLTPVMLARYQQSTWPGPGFLFSGKHVFWTVAVFLLFRLFDVVKPWPVRQSQALPGGWGVTVDDLLATVYVNAVIGAVWACRSM